MSVIYDNAGREVNFKPPEEGPDSCSGWHNPGVCNKCGEESSIRNYRDICIDCRLKEYSPEEIEQALRRFVSAQLRN